MIPHRPSLAAQQSDHGAPDGALAVGEHIELRVGAIAAGGGCVGRAPDGRVVFVRHSIPGELVVAKLTAVTSSFLRADAVEILEPATARRPAPCPYAGPGRCGGCDWQHIDLSTQRELKGVLVQEQLRRLAHHEIAVTVEAMPGETDGLGWRSRVRFAVDRNGAVGFRRHRSHEIELIKDCPLAAPPLRARKVERSRWPGAAEVEAFAPGTDEDDEATILVVPGRRGVRVGDLPSDVPNAGIVAEGHVVREPHACHPSVLGRRFRVTAGSFWQVHAAAPEFLTRALLDALQLRPGEQVADLYAGVGLFSVPFAEAVRGNGKVIAVERSRGACADARHNAARLPQLEVRAHAVDEALVRGLWGVDVVVLDPPREGAGRALTSALVAMVPAPRVIAYLSCDAASFARDLAVFFDSGWKLRSLRAFDLFPTTEHVELLAIVEPGT